MEGATTSKPKEIGQKVIGWVVMLGALAALSLPIEAYKEHRAGTRVYAAHSVCLGITPEALAKYRKVVSLDDTFGLNELFLKKQVFGMASGTPALVLESDFDGHGLMRNDLSMWQRKVRILGGPNAGVAGWINDADLLTDLSAR